MKKTVKILSVISLILNILITLIRFIGVQGYMAAITRDFSYLDKLSVGENQRSMIMEKNMPINGYLNLTLLALGLIIIITLIINFKNHKNGNKIFIPYISMICYGIIEIINILVKTPVEYESILGGALFIFLGLIPALCILYSQDSQEKSSTEKL